MPDLEPQQELWVIMILWESGASKKWIPTTATCLSLKEGTIKLRYLEDIAEKTKSEKRYMLQRYIPASNFGG
jgi:hypothetical protein